MVLLLWSISPGPMIRLTSYICLTGIATYGPIQSHAKLNVSQGCPTAADFRLTLWLLACWTGSGK